MEDEFDDLSQIDLSAPAGTSIDDPVQTYLKEIGEIPLLTADEEAKLAVRIAGGDEAAKERMTEGCLRLVVGIARQYVGEGVLFSDLIQEGTLGLMRAVEEFDFQKGYKFATYAARWIRQEITRTIADQAESSRISDHLVESVNKQQDVSRQLTRELDREPTVEEIAGRMGISVGEVQEIQKVAQDAEALNTPEEEEENGQSQNAAAQDDEAPEPTDDAGQKMLKEQMDAGAMEKLKRENQSGGLRGYVDED